MRFSCLISSLVVSASVRAVRYRRKINAHSGDSTAESLLVPISTDRPDPILFPPRSRAPFGPVNVEIEGPKHTNKFWGNWIVHDADDDNSDFGIFPAPYSLKLARSAGGISIMKGETQYSGITATTPWASDFILGAAERFTGAHAIVREQHFGVHVQMRPSAGSSCQATYPVFAGMAYPSGRFEGGCTPQVTSEYGLKMIEKVRPGVWRFLKNSAAKEYRVYVLTSEGEFVDDSYDFDSAGKLNKQLDGWVRLADLQQPSDVDVLDEHARAILVGWEFEVEDGTLRYTFETVGSNNLLHWAYANHMAFLSGGAQVSEKLTRTRAPTKGKMFPLVGGLEWTFDIDLNEALNVDFMPAEEPRSHHLETVLEAVEQDWRWLSTNWRSAMHRRDHYFSGKGFQKIGTVCHMMAKHRGKDHPDVQACARVLQQGFQCMYKRSVSDGSDRRFAGPDGRWLQGDGCWWAPAGTWYDETWGGIPSRETDPGCRGTSDFGSYCYNDHHYHFGYYVVGAAMLVDLMPSMKDDRAFVDFINMFIRDVANPSKEDKYFPQFRSFDWFDMHSWSRGLKPDVSGKDQESTSEEVNMHYGVMLWGKMFGNQKMQKLGATMLTVASRALQDYFIMKRDNPNYPANFSINHVTGIFFQNKIKVTTWFGHESRYIHGIQMLPMSPALQMSRKADFAKEEWDDILSKIPVSHSDPWWSILFSGNLAMHRPEAAWSNLMRFQPWHFDDGLTRSWALYWTSIQQAEGVPPEPAPVPTPPAPPPPPPAPTQAPGTVYCNPNAQPAQLCPPGNVACPDSGVCP